MKIHAASRPADDAEAKPHHWTVEAEDYETGMREVRMSIPEGWLLMYVRVEREASPTTTE